MLVMVYLGPKDGSTVVNMLASFVNLVNIHQGTVYMVLFNEVFS
jgi:hypothetical protein